MKHNYLKSRKTDYRRINMNFSFSRVTTEVTSQQIKQVKKWIYEYFEIDRDISISLSQLQCKEENCSPIETVISVMTNPLQQYKIHKKITDIESTDISLLVKNKNNCNQQK
jgi:hypothetical protein